MDVKAREDENRRQRWKESAAADAMAVLRGLKRRTNVCFLYVAGVQLNFTQCHLQGRRGGRRRELRLKKEAGTQLQVFAHQFHAIFFSKPQKIQLRKFCAYI